MNISNEVEGLLKKAINFAKENHQEYVTPEHILYVLCFYSPFETAFTTCGGDIEELMSNLLKFLKDNVIEKINKEPELTDGVRELLLNAQNRANSSQKYIIEFPHVVSAIIELQESYASYFMLSQGIDETEFMYEICQNTDEELQFFENEEIYDDFSYEDDQVSEKSEKWRSFVECINDTLEDSFVLIGREKEMERTVQILCRKNKNNPLHIGEPGVGKTAITYGLARLINEEKVPEPLLNSKIYTIDLPAMLAGTQYRGDVEKRFKEIMKGIEKEDKPIIYIDEIHNIVGAGAVNGGSLDISNMLKPYLTQGKIRFIGATTFEEYKKYFSKNKSLVRRFQNVEVKEPSEEDTLCILEGIKKQYEKYHNVKYQKGVLAYAISLSSKYINERYLPDKAVDLIDEAGAFRRMNPLNQKSQTVDKKVIDYIVSTICNIPKQIIESDEINKLANLENRISNKVFGQQEAITEVVNAVKFARAGLVDDNKPLASLLFVGPTGVGKTEVARSLSEELGIKLIRFDMSEYQEKHAVAKLIGAPAGYVGYEEGGLLIEEVRKNPHAVLLLDEIEKAHSDIYNVLLQVMDYATLTDNQGRKADFRNVIIIMTSNAGASKLGKGMIGFGTSEINKDAIKDEVKRIFQPEFRNRLTKVLIFNSIDKKMAKLIVNKKINELIIKLENKKVNLKVSDEGINYIIEQGFSHEYGAREIIRVIDNKIKPLLVEQILFGKLKKGGMCTIEYSEGKLSLQINR